MRYIEKDTGIWWKTTGWCYDNGIKNYHLSNWDDINNEITVTEKELAERFEAKPFNDPSIRLDPVIPRHPIRIILYCPECGSELRIEGGALLSSPPQYINICTNPSCRYDGTTTSSYYSGMYAALTEEQKEAIIDGKYSVEEHGEIIKLKEENLWTWE